MQVLECGGNPDLSGATPLWISSLKYPKRRRRPDKSGLCRRTPKNLKFAFFNFQFAMLFLLQLASLFHTLPSP
jgi:hypothetical protein